MFCILHKKKYIQFMEKRNNKFIVLFMSDRMCVYHVVSFGSLESLKVKISKLVRSVFFRANLSPYTSIFEMSIYIHI